MKKLFPLMLVLAGLVMLTGCATEPKSEEGRENLADESRATLDQFKRKDANLQNFLDRSAGYAIFPSVGKGGVGVGGAFGRGILYSNNGDLIGYSSLSQASVGLQLGGQEYAELVVFENRDSLNKFTQGNFSFAANASAVALKEGASAAAPYRNGVAVFTMAKGGLMFEASIGGQKFNFVSAENARNNTNSNNNEEIRSNSGGGNGNR